MIYREIDISEIALYKVSQEMAEELIDYRLDNVVKKLRNFSQRSFNRALKEAVKCLDLGITPDKAIQLSVDKLWVSVTYDYVKNELQGRQGNGRSQGYSQQTQTRSGRADAQFREILGRGGPEH